MIKKIQYIYIFNPNYNLFTCQFDDIQIMKGYVSKEIPANKLIKVLNHFSSLTSLIFVFNNNIQMNETSHI